MTTPRDQLHALLDTVPDDRLADVEAALIDATAPYRPLSEAPEDDEPVTDEDLEAIREGHEEHLRGETIPHDEAMRRIGLR